MKEKINKRTNIIKKLSLTYEEIENLNDEDLVLINTSFLYFTIAYYQLINKINPNKFSLINKILNQSEKLVDPRYLKILVKDVKYIYQNFPKDRIRTSAFIKYINSLSGKNAYNLLTEGIIQDENDLERGENRWIKHSLYVGEAARRIAKKLNVNEDLALSLGYIHDIGRRINHFNHPIEGYKYMIDKGYSDYARICLTHSFIDNDITLTAGGGPKTKETYEFINRFLMENPKNIYDNIIQLCDLFCLETGFTTIEKRILDITKRKGIYDNSYNHFMKTIELKERIEEMMGCNLYDLFPEINKEDLDNIESDYLELINLLKPKKLTL